MRTHTASHCAALGDTARNGGAVLINDRQNLGPGESFTERGSFTAVPGVSYRICAYLGDFNDQVAPDARAERLVCTASAHVSSNECVANARPAVRISAPARARGRFTARLSFTAGASDHNISLYAQPSRIPCYRTGEDERNHGFRGTRTIVSGPITAGRAGSRTVSVSESRGGATRLCAYVFGFNDLGRPSAFASALVR